MAWRRWVSVGAICVLTGCQPSPGFSPNLPHGGGASIDLSMAPVPASQAAYRVQAGDQTVSDFTPSSFKATISRISLLRGDYSPGAGGDGNPVTVFKSEQVVELAENQAGVAAGINQEALSVEPDTYTAISIELTGPYLITGQASVGDQTFYTKSSFSSDTTQAPAEALSLDMGGPPQIVKFTTPLVIKEGDRVKLSLLYDLTGSLKFETVETGKNQYANGSSVSAKYFPMFAFVGAAPTPEIYDVTISDPDRIVQSSDKWHYRVLMFADPATGEVEGLNSIGMIDPGYSYGSFEVGSFVDSWRKPIRNGDGTYQLFTLNDMDPTKIPQWEVPAFQRATHEGQAKFFAYNRGIAMTEPATLSYHCVKVQ